MGSGKRKGKERKGRAKEKASEQHTEKRREERDGHEKDRIKRKPITISMAVYDRERIGRTNHGFDSWSTTQQSINVDLRECP